MAIIGQAREMARQLRAFAALTGDLGFGSKKPCQVVHNCLYLSGVHTPHARTLKQNKCALIHVLEKERKTQTKSLETSSRKPQQKTSNAGKRMNILGYEALACLNGRGWNEPVHIRVIARKSRAQNKDRGLKTLRENCQVPHKDKPIRERAGPLSRGPSGQKSTGWSVSSVETKSKKDCLERLLQPEKLFSKVEGQIKTFPDKHQSNSCPWSQWCRRHSGGVHGGGRKKR